MPAVLNIAAYKFVAIDDPAQVRERVLAAASALALKGTVLIATEGINLFLAGPHEAVHAFMAELRRDARFADLATKNSESEDTPFRRLRVKVKCEIIRMNEPAVRPQAGRAPVLDAQTLARWLAQGHDDAGREVVMLDTRNGFEVDRGRFAGAIDWRLGRFSDFPAALKAHREALEGKTVVSYCTGGIRCEKAALHMSDLGLAQVWQLDGGILGYFAALPGAPHWQGECFVFDERIALDASLAPPREAHDATTATAPCTD